MAEIELRALFLCLALIVDGLLGNLKSVLPHILSPKTWFEAVLNWLEEGLNKPKLSINERRRHGVYGLGFALIFGLLISYGLAQLFMFFGKAGLLLEFLILCFFIKARTIIDHVTRVAKIIRHQDLKQAQIAIEEIVGRDPESLDAHGVARAAIESATVQLSFQLIAPMFWYLIGGLTGLIAYHIIALSAHMFSVKSGAMVSRHAAYGLASQKLDQMMKYFPMRISGLMITFSGHFLCSRGRESLKVMWRDSGKHFSSDLGWPTAAMAGALGLALAGPRIYNGQVKQDPWINARARMNAGPEDIWNALRLLKSEIYLLVPVLSVVAMLLYLFSL